MAVITSILTGTSQKSIGEVTTRTVHGRTIGQKRIPKRDIEYTTRQLEHLYAMFQTVYYYYEFNPFAPDYNRKNYNNKQNLNQIQTSLFRNYQQTELPTKFYNLITSAEPIQMVTSDYGQMHLDQGDDYISITLSYEPRLRAGDVLHIISATTALIKLQHYEIVLTQSILDSGVYTMTIDEDEREFCAFFECKSKKYYGHAFQWLSTGFIYTNNPTPIQPWIRYCFAQNLYPKTVVGVYLSAIPTATNGDVRFLNFFSPPYVALEHPIIKLPTANGLVDVTLFWTLEVDGSKSLCGNFPQHYTIMQSSLLCDKKIIFINH